MCCKGLFKRLVPFFLALVAGLFIASFFVDIGPPRFGGGFRAKRFHEMQQLRIENDQLRDENLRLQDEIDTMRRNPINLKHYEKRDWDSGPDVRDPVPLAPPRPVRLHGVDR